VLQRSSEAAENRSGKDEEVKDNVFKNMYIPRSCAELSTEEIYQIKKEGREDELEKFQKLANFESTLE
jgi:hypothetical protein